MGIAPPRWRRALKRLQWMGTDTLFSLGLGGSLHRQRPGTRVLIYHGIDETGSTAINTRYISRASLDQHLEYFASECEVVPLGDLMDGNLEADRLTIALTFDDGYANNLELALPALEKHRLPATFFITGILAEGAEILWPDMVDLASQSSVIEIEVAGERYRNVRRGGLISTTTGQRLLERCKRARWSEIEAVMDDLRPLLSTALTEVRAPSWRPLTPAGIKKLASSDLVEIGAHGHYHTSLGLIPHDEAVTELRRSKTSLETLIGREVSSVAFPDGSYTRPLVDAADELGYRRQLVVDYLFDDDVADARLAERLGVNPFMTWDNQLWCILRGGY